jgi:hypothetical protein
MSQGRIPRAGRIGSQKGARIGEPEAGQRLVIALAAVVHSANGFDII